MSRFVGLSSVLVAAALGVSPVYAQNKDDLSPSNEELNKELDQSLKKEYSEDHPPPPSAEPLERSRSSSDRDEIKITLGLMGAYYHTQLFDTEVTYREGSSGGTPVKFDRRGHKGKNKSAFDLKDDTGTYRAWLDLGKHISITGQFEAVRYQDSKPLVSDPTTGTPGFTFGNTTFQTGDVVKATFDLMLADTDLVLKPLNNKWVTIDLSVGVRYIYWKSSFRRLNGPSAEVTSRVEGAMPMIGVGLAVRPVKVLEIFGRVRAGGLSYKVRTSDYSPREVRRYDIQDQTRDMRSAEVTAGIRLIFGDHVGLILGYRLDYINLEREVVARKQKVKTKSHGAYAGLIIQF